MYWLKPGIKNNPERRWRLPDRIFFGHGACHILAGVFLDMKPLPGFHAEKITPHEDFAGNHVYVTDSVVAFDYHGYSLRERLLAHHRRGWSTRYPGWGAVVERVDFSLLDTSELNRRKMLGPDQYFGDPVLRARGFIGRVSHLEISRRTANQTTSLIGAPPLLVGSDLNNFDSN